MLPEQEIIILGYIPLLELVGWDELPTQILINTARRAISELPLNFMAYPRESLKILRSPLSMLGSRTEGIVALLLLDKFPPGGDEGIVDMLRCLPYIIRLALYPHVLNLINIKWLYELASIECGAGQGWGGIELILSHCILHQIPLHKVFVEYLVNQFPDELAERVRSRCATTVLDVVNVTLTTVDDAQIMIRLQRLINQQHTHPQSELVDLNRQHLSLLFKITSKQSDIYTHVKNNIGAFDYLTKDDPYNPTGKAQWYIDELELAKT